MPSCTKRNLVRNWILLRLKLEKQQKINLVDATGHFVSTPVVIYPDRIITMAFLTHELEPKRQNRECLVVRSISNATVKSNKYKYNGFMFNILFLKQARSGMLTKILSLSRYIMILPVIGAFFGSFALIVYQIAVIANSIMEILLNLELTSKASKTYAVRIVESVDIFLIAIAVYIISLGLYSLFIDNTLELPSWLKISNLEDLKDHLLSVVVAVLSVLFLSEAVAWDGKRDVLSFGLSVSATIAAVAFYLKREK